jgi:hypothetical protein
MAYIPKVWEDDPSTVSPLDEDNLNHIEQGIYHAGDSIELSIDSSTYVMLLKLKDSSGATISSGTIDLPLETMVVGAEYDSDTKEIVLTLKDGTTVRFSVADLVEGLVSEDSLEETLQDYVQDSDLTNYVKNTDYATSSKGGVVKVNSTYNLSIDNGSIYPAGLNITEYNNANNRTFIGKYTLENVITGKDLTTKAYVDGLVGDISSAIDLINGESI